MSTVQAEAIDAGHRFKSPVFLSDVRYDTTSLVVTLTSPDDRIAATLTFTDVVGFRVLDEGDLLEFWPDCASDHGWLFRITAHGWFDQEIARRGFLHDRVPGLGEFFVASQNDCISVLAGQPPRASVLAF